MKQKKLEKQKLKAARILCKSGKMWSSEIAAVLDMDLREVNYIMSGRDLHETSNILIFNPDEDSREPLTESEVEKLNTDNFDESTLEMIKSGALILHTEQDEIEALKSEEDREIFLVHVMDGNEGDTWFLDQVKEAVRQSRIHYKHPVPEDEFFGF